MKWLFQLLWCSVGLNLIGCVYTHEIHTVVTQAP